MNKKLLILIGLAILIYLWRKPAQRITPREAQRALDIMRDTTFIDSLEAWVAGGCVP